MHRRPVPGDAVPRWPATRWCTADSTSGTGWRSPRASASTMCRSGFEGQPIVEQGRRRTAAVRGPRTGATCAGVRVWSLYVPNGRTLADPHYQYKLEWLAALRETAGSWLQRDPDAQIALVGDWNIAPADEDVWDMAVFQRVHACLRAGAQGVQRDRRHPVRRRGPAVHARAGGVHLLGLHPAARSPSARACASTSSSAHRVWRSGWCTPRSCARSEKGRARDQATGAAPSDRCRRCCE